MTALLAVILFAIGAHGRRYRAHDHVGIVANTAGPFNNPTETYPVSFRACYFSTLELSSQPINPIYMDNILLYFCVFLIGSVSVNSTTNYLFVAGRGDSVDTSKI